MADGCHPSLVGSWENGIKDLGYERLVELAGCMGLAQGDVDLALLAVDAVAGISVRRRGKGELLGNGQKRSKKAIRPAEDRLLIDERLAQQTAARLGLAMASLVSPRVLARLRCQRIEESRRDAKRRWRELQGFDHRQKRRVVESLEEFQCWAVAERIAEESTQVAATGAGAATDLAALAVRVAELADVEPGFQRRLVGFTRAFVANGLRVESRLREADQELEAAKSVWSAGEDPQGILPEWRLWDLEASLRRDQGRFAEALELHEQTQMEVPNAVGGRILLNKGTTLEQAGDIEGAVTALQQAEPLVKRFGTLRDQWVLGFNLAVNFCHLGDNVKAWDRLSGLQQLAQSLGNEMDLRKVEWLRGRVAAALGRRAEAYEVLGRVLEAYAAGQNPLAMAMVSLELSVLYLEDGNTRVVRTLAEFMVGTFMSEGVAPEAHIALGLFVDAARQDAATVGEARRLLVVLEKAAGVRSKAH